MEVEHSFGWIDGWMRLRICLQNAVNRWSRTFKTSMYLRTGSEDAAGMTCVDLLKLTSATINLNDQREDVGWMQTNGTTLTVKSAYYFSLNPAFGGAGRSSGSHLRDASLIPNMVSAHLAM